MAKRELKRDKALALAQKIVETLTPACERIEIAGSLRRGNAVVGDIEIVAIPRFEKRVRDGLFSVPTSMIDVLVDELRDAGKVYPEKNGPRYKKLAITTAKPPVGLDLFIADADNWGYIFAIRTGPHQYSKHVVTQRFKGGALDDDHRTGDGYVWRSVASLSFTDNAPSAKTTTHDGLQYVMVPVPEEADFFTLIKGGYVEPEKRRYQ